MIVSPDASGSFMQKLSMTRSVIDTSRHTLSALTVICLGADMIAEVVRITWYVLFIVLLVSLGVVFPSKDRPTGTAYTEQSTSAFAMQRVKNALYGPTLGWELAVHSNILNPPVPCADFSVVSKFFIPSRIAPD